MSVKNNILSLFICSICLFLNSSCGGSSDTDEPTKNSTDAPKSRELTLRWDPQPLLGSDGRDLSIFEYRIYRGTTSGDLDWLDTVIVKNNPPLSTDSTYIDKTVITGQAYFYSISAINLLGDESPVSSEVTMTAP